MRFRRRRKPDRESQQALKDATKNLHRIRARTPEVTEVSESLKTFRKRNHIAEQLTVIMEGRQ